MCVIMASETHKPTEAQMRAGWEQNPYGAGVAWIEDTKKGKITRWVKGIATIEEVLKLVATIKPPMVVHFRIPTEGLEDKELTHPFPITTDAKNLYEGSTEGQVLFHNGGWANWRPFSLDTCLKGQVKLPEGMLNDSRMMAWNAAIYGEEILQLINEKAIVFGPGKFALYGTDKANGWRFTRVDGDTGIWFSNDLWEKHLPKPKQESYRIAGGQGSFAGRGGDRQDPSFRPQDQPAGSSSDVSGQQPDENEVEGSQATVHLGPQQGGKTGETTSLVDSPQVRMVMRRIHQDPDQVAKAMYIDRRRVPGFTREMVH